MARSMRSVSGRGAMAQQIAQLQPKKGISMPTLQQGGKSYGVGPGGTTIQGAHGGTQQLGAAAQRRMGSGGGSGPIISPDVSTPGRMSDQPGGEMSTPGHPSDGGMQPMPGGGGPMMSPMSPIRRAIGTAMAGGLAGPAGAPPKGPMGVSPWSGATGAIPKPPGGWDPSSFSDPMPSGVSPSPIGKPTIGGPQNSGFQPPPMTGSPMTQDFGAGGLQEKPMPGAPGDQMPPQLSDVLQRFRGAGGLRGAGSQPVNNNGTWIY